MLSFCFLTGVLFVGGYLSWNFGKFYHRRPLLHCIETNDWIDVNKDPIPGTIKEYLATDGYIVHHCQDIKYNRSGKPCLPLYVSNKEITHWLPMPKAPLITNENSFHLNKKFGIYT